MTPSVRSRRDPDESVHDFQHRLITERRAVFEATTRRYADRIRRREADKAACWTFVGHLRRHGLKRQVLGLSWQDLEELHRKFHETEETP